MFVKFSLDEDYRGLPKDVFSEENVLLGQQTFIYGRNGSGKTTFSEALRRFANSDNEAPGMLFQAIEQGAIESRRWDPEGGPFQIHVFNRFYVEKSLSPFIKGEADIEGLVHIGTASVDASAKINRLDESIVKIRNTETRLDQLSTKADGEKDALLRDAQTEIIAGLAHVDPARYTKQGFNIAKVKRILEGAPTSLPGEEHERHLRIAKTRTPSKISPLQPPRLIPELEPERVSGEVLAITPKQALLKELQENRKLQTWVEEGMDLHGAEEPCRFCTNGVYSGERKGALQGHFSDEFNSLRKMARQRARQLQSYIEELVAFGSIIEDLKAERLMEGEQELPPLIDAAVRATNAVLVLANSGTKALDTKADNPAADVVWNCQAEDLAFEVDKLNSLLEKHNIAVADFDRLKAEAAAAIEAHHVAEVYSVVVRKERKKERCAEFIQLLAELAGRKQQELVELRAKMEDTEELAKRIDADVRYVFGHHSLNIATADSGKAYRILRAGRPAKNLSEGEGNAIAFAYFLNSLSADGIDLPSSLVVIDDPVTSLDKDALFAGYSLAMDRLSTAGQLIILTHDFDYFRLLLNSIIPDRKLKVNAASEKEVDKDSVFPRQSVLELLHGTSRRGPRLRRIATNQGKALSEYHYLFQLIGHALIESDEADDLRLYGNAGRRLLEGFIAFRAPHKTDFQSRVDYVRETCGNAIRQDLSVRMVKFLHAGSHRTDPSPSSSLDVTSVIADLSAVMEFIAMSDADHFSGMCRAAAIDPGDLVDSVAIGGH